MAFACKRVITINHAQVGSSADQSNFPVFVSLTLGSAVVSANGYDVWFYSSDNRVLRLSAERESWNNSSKVWSGWVKIPSISTSVDTTFYVFYADSGISADPNADGTYGSATVWDNYYKTVLHLGDGTTASSTDSTGNNTVTRAGSPSPSAVTGAFGGGLLGGGLSFDTAYSNELTTTYDFGASNLNANVDYSFEFWFWSTTKSGSRIMGFDVAQTGTSSSAFDRHVYLDTAGAIRYGVYPGNYAPGTSDGVDRTNGAWHHVLFSHADSTSGSTHLVIDGTDNDGGTMHAYNGYSGAVYLRSCSFEGGWGSSALGFWTGRLDEMRVSIGVARSADWGKMCYANQNAPATFSTLGPEQLLTHTSFSDGGGLAQRHISVGNGMSRSEWAS